uniref:Uncharacterized protein n=1 Tax=Sphaerodactylus townsendi TaxID=933632 RepID=A0ACB8FTL1_9SAUR
MIGKRAGEPGAAETGIQTTTVKAKDYHHPTLPQVILWDLPGREDSAFASRIEQVDLNRFDFFIIVGYQRFKTVHADLVHEIQAMGKRFYFVRAKIDLLTLESNLQRRQRHPAFSNEREKVLQHIKGAPPISLPSLSTPVLERKTDSVKLKQDTHSSMPSYSALLALLPVPGFSFVAAMFFFVRFRSQCYREFGLDDPSLTALARDIGKPVAAFHAVMKSRSLMPLILWRLPDLVGAVLILVEYCWWNRYPYAGSLVSGVISGFTSYYMLQSCIVAVAKDTQNVLAKALEKMSV